MVDGRYYIECISLRANPNTQEENGEYLAMTDLRSRLYFNNHWINFNVRFDIYVDGHIDEDQSNKDLPNLKYCIIPFLKFTSMGFLQVFIFNSYGM